MATEPRQIPVAPSPEAARRRLNNHGIKEMPAGYDAEVAELFRDLRAASNLSETDLAARLGTRMEVVQALEQGALYALPPWPETCRIVNGYGALLNLDVRPLLRRIYAQLEAGIVELRPRAMPDVPTMNTPEPADYGYGANHGMPQPPPQAGRPGMHPGYAQQQPQPQQPQPQPHPQGAWPGAAPQHAPYPAPHQQQPQHPQANRHPQQARPAQAHAPHPHPQPPLAPQPQATPDAVMEPEPDKPRRKSALLKWGLIALAVSVIAFALWMALSSFSGPSGSEDSSPTGSSAPVLDPDDPRSRKTDRLPSPN